MQPFWVEEELVVEHGDERLAQMSFDEPLDEFSRESYARALRLQAELLVPCEHLPNGEPAA